MAAKKILVVDDNATDLKNMEQIVAGAGCMVVSATGGTEALAKAKSEKPDLIFLDIVMPDLDGYATVRALRADSATKSIPVVFVSSKGQQADKVWAQMQGGTDLVVKPFTKEQIIEQLKRAA
jgi:twitching motility two-component system response regulator PilH